MNNLVAIVSRQEDFILHSIHNSNTNSNCKKLLLAGFIPNGMVDYIQSIGVQTLVHSLYIDQIINQDSGCNLPNSSVTQYDEFNQDKLTSEQFKETALLIYFWPKTKSQAIVDFYHIYSSLNQDTKIMVVGDNDSGIKTIAKNLELNHWEQLDNAKRARIYITSVTNQLDSQYLTDLLRNNSGLYNLTIEDKELTIHSLPGVFSAKNFDQGSFLLANYLIEHPNLLIGHDHILDYGSGSGVLSTILLKIYPQIKSITLLDNYLLAMISAKININLNSPEYNNKAKFNLCANLAKVENNSIDLLISNPPFHQDKAQGFAVIERLVSQAKTTLKKNGKLLIVANSHLPYMEMLSQSFKHVDVIDQNNQFKLYMAHN